MSYGQQGGYGGGYGGSGGGGGNPYGAPPPQQHGGYGAPPPSGGYGGGHQQGGGYGAPPPQQSHGSHSGGGHGGYGGSSHGGSHGGHGGPPPVGFSTRPKPPQQYGGDPQLRSWFQAVDRDGSGHIDARELQQALINGDWSSFDIDTVKLLLNMFDVDRSGTITFDEFVGVWKYIKDWQGAFRHFDRDNSGTIAGSELNSALTNFGYNLPPHLVNMLERKYVTPSDEKPGSFPQPGGHAGYGRPPASGITFDRFVRCCVVVKTLTESFQKHDPDRNGWVNMSYQTFMELAIAAP